MLHIRSAGIRRFPLDGISKQQPKPSGYMGCLLYTSDAADERSSVDLGGRRIIKKKKHQTYRASRNINTNNKTKEDTTTT